MSTFRRGSEAPSEAQTCLISEPDDTESNPSSFFKGSSNGIHRLKKLASAEKVPVEKKSTKGGGAVVEIDDAQNPLPMQAFEISDEFKENMSNQSMYRFTRSARKSLLLGLGQGTGLSTSTDDTSYDFDVIDPYTKANDQTCIYNYMGVVIGFGVLGLPHMMAHCGIIPGIVSIVAFGFLNSFWAHRLVEIPALVSSNLERYGDIAKVCFPNTYGIAFIAIISTWYGLTLISYYCALYYSRHHVVLEDHPVIGYGMEFGFCLIYLFLSFRSSVKENQKRCIWAVRIMYVILGLVIICSVCHGVATFHADKYDLVAEDWGQIASGMLKVGLSYTGLGILPYIVSEMLNPNNARKVANRAVYHITVYNVAIALVGYLGWGKEVPDSISRAIEKLAEANLFYRVISTMITILLLFKFLLVYPIFFMPLLRELEGFLQLDSSPPMSLGLPWAIKSVHRSKIVLRVIVVFSSLLVYWLCNDFFLVAAVLMIPFFLTQLILPSILSMKAMVMWHHIEWHSKKHDEDASKKCSSKGGAKRQGGMFGEWWWQVFVTAVLAVISIGVGALAISESFCVVLEKIDLFSSARC